MKLMRKSLSVLFSILLLVPFIQSCSDSDDSYSAIFGTVHLLDTNDYYFLLDTGEKMYPGDKTEVAGYKAEEGKRVLIFFRLLDEKISGYDFNARIVFLDDLLMKDIIMVNNDNEEEEEEKIGNDPINITYAWFAGNCINIEFQFLGIDTPENKHLISLIYKEAEKPEIDSDYLELELRHNAFEDNQGERLSGLIAFKQLPEAGSTYEKIRIHYNSIYEGKKTYIIDIASSNITIEKIKKPVLNFMK